MALMHFTHKQNIFKFV